MDRKDFILKVENYQSIYPEEQDFKNRFIKILQSPEAFERTHLPGHITGSAFIVSPDRTQTLLVHHAKLNKWIQPGGHADGDTDVARVAMRETNEETGLQHLVFSSTEIFDLDIHTIPARKDFPQHEHYDVRYLIEGSLSEKIIVSHESHDVKWVLLQDLEDYNNEKAILRMRDKLNRNTSR